MSTTEFLIFIFYGATFLVCGLLIATLAVKCQDWLEPMTDQPPGLTRSATSAITLLCNLAAGLGVVMAGLGVFMIGTTLTFFVLLNLVGA